jgi:hypothetical protein
VDFEPFTIFLARAYGWSVGLDNDGIGLWISMPGSAGDPSKLVHIATPKNWCYVGINN